MSEEFDYSDFDEGEDDDDAPEQRMPGFVRGSETSKAAAQKLKGARQDAQGLRILRVFMEGGDYTADEIDRLLSARTGGRVSSVAARFSNLTKAACIVLTGVRRKTSSGADAEVYTLATGATEERWKTYSRDKNAATVKGFLEWKRAVIAAALAYFHKDTPEALNALAAVAKEAPFKRQGSNGQGH